MFLGVLLKCSNGSLSLKRAILLVTKLWLGDAVLEVLASCIFEARVFGFEFPSGSLGTSGMVRIASYLSLLFPRSTS